VDRGSSGKVEDLRYAYRPTPTPSGNADAGKVSSGWGNRRLLLRADGNTGETSPPRASPVLQGGRGPDGKKDRARRPRRWTRSRSMQFETAHGQKTAPWREGREARGRSLESRAGWRRGKDSGQDRSESPLPTAPAPRRAVAGVQKTSRQGGGPACRMPLPLPGVLRKALARQRLLTCPEPRKATSPTCLLLRNPANGEFRLDESPLTSGAKKKRESPPPLPGREKSTGLRT